MVIPNTNLHPNGTQRGAQRGARNPRTLFRVRFSWASLFRWYALKNARVPPANVLSRLRRGKNGQTPVPSSKRIAKEGWTRPQEDAAKPPLIGADGHER